jgi:DUF1009 family protein
VERSLGLMCGAGTLPARMASHARKQGWRVLAFVFTPPGQEPPGLAAHVDQVIPASVGQLGAVLATLVQERVSATLFSGKFWMTDVLATAGRDGGLDATTSAMWSHAGSLRDAALTNVIVTTLAGQGIDVLDQRPFLADALIGPGVLTARAPSDDAAADVRCGLAIASALTHTGAGQTVVLRRGIVTALEAVEGTTEAIRRGCALAGPGAVIVKAVADGHDYRFDAPAIGPETVDAAARGGATVIALSARRVLLLEREAALRRADGAGIAIVGLDAS